MKKLHLIVLAFLFSTSLLGQGYEKIKEADPEGIKISEDFANEYFKLVKQDKYYEFKDEATSQVKNSLTPDLQKNVYSQLKGQFGEFESLEYAETWTQGGSGINIHRFKATFNDSIKKLEVRVVLDKENKIAGFFVFPWSDMLR